MTAYYKSWTSTITHTKPISREDEDRAQMSEEYENINTTQGRTKTNDTPDLSHPHRQAYGRLHMQIHFKYSSGGQKQPSCRHR